MSKAGLWPWITRLLRPSRETVKLWLQGNPELNASEIPFAKVRTLRLSLSLRSYFLRTLPRIGQGLAAENFPLRSALAYFLLASRAVWGLIERIFA
jgi:hypothetical protein